MAYRDDLDALAARARVLDTEVGELQGGGGPLPIAQTEPALRHEENK